jgi:hypothetical protein
VEDDLGQTVQFDSSKVRAIPKPTSRDLPAEQAAAFDPEATVVSSKVSDGTQQVKPRDTGNLEPPSQTQYYGAPASAPSTGPMSPSAAPTVVSSAPPVPSEPLPSTPTSAPLPPAQTSAPLPPTEVVSSQPVAPSGPIPPAQTQAAAAAQTSQPLPPAAAPKKRSKLPLILGILAVLIVFFVGAVAVAGYFLWYKPQQLARARERVVITEPSQPSSSLPATTATPSEAPIPSNEPEPYNPPADAVQFVNSPEDLKGRLAENFVAFNFYYPNRWVKVPSTENFIMVERRLPPDFTQENFAVAPWYSTDDTTTFDDAYFQKLVARDDANFAKRFPEYRKVSEGPVKAGAYDGYELRFEAVSRGTDKGDVTLWGREIFFAPREGEKAGVKFLILTTSLAPELRNIDDVGAKGELPMLLESFRFGK